MDTQLTSDQVLAMAPDTSSAAAGKKLNNVKHWKSLGRNAEALWGECQGSALYQVKVDLSSFTTQCSCPSRKFPCKHSLGLLLLAATSSTTITTSEPPEWVSTWLAKRQASSERKQARVEKAATEGPSATQQKTAEKRLATVNKGLNNLDLWLNDLVKQGLASVQTQPASFWENQAARLRDAQAPALDSRLRRIATIPNSSHAWPEKLLAQLGKLALLTHAFRQAQQPDWPNSPLHEDMRQLIGWNLTQEEVATLGETVVDDWLFLGQAVEEEERMRVQRTWLYGRRTGRSALLLQFAVGSAPYPEMYPIGTHQEAEVIFWPAAYTQRARMGRRQGAIAPVNDPFATTSLIEAFLGQVATALSQQPWLERFLSTLHEVIPVYDQQQQRWYIRDAAGAVLPLAAGDHWLLLAISGGLPVDLAGEWNGEVLLPFGVLAGDEYTLLRRDA